MPLVRPFEPADVNAVVSLILPIQRDEFGFEITLDDQPDLGDIPSFYLSGSGNFWVAECDGAIVGTIALRDIGFRRAALRKMFVAAPYRGRTHGVAKALLYALVEWSQEKALDAIYLGTTAKFLAAHRFYEKNGFVEVSKTQLPPGFPAMTLDTKFYRLNVADISSATTAVASTR